MSQCRGEEPQSATGHRAAANSDVLLAESKRVSDLPGLWAKTVTVEPDQIGFLASKGVVVRELGSGTTRVCMSFLGLTGGSKEVRLFRVRPFRFRITRGRASPANAASVVVEITALIANPSLLHASLDGRGRLYASQLAENIAAAIGSEPGEQPLGTTATDELNMPIRRVMAERGLQVDRIETVTPD